LVDLFELYDDAQTYKLLNLQKPYLMNREVAYAKNPLEYFASLSVRIMYAVLL
jgi:hypothetical protein